MIIEISNRRFEAIKQSEQAAFATADRRQYSAEKSRASRSQSRAGSSAKRIIFGSMRSEKSEEIKFQEGIELARTGQVFLHDRSAAMNPSN